MLRRSLHIAVVTLFLLATSAAAAPAELPKPPIERTAIAALWKKVVSFFDFAREAATPAQGRVKGTPQLIAGDDGSGEQPLDGESMTWAILPEG